uniref:Uncharacterized protein n=1 Tax=Arundo donax TaxID=35708 RepID=A0A0A9A875_ARUDO
MQEKKIKTKPRELLIGGRNINLHSLHPWERGGHLLARQRRRTRAAPGRKLQEPYPLPRQCKSRASSARSLGAWSVFKHGSKGEAKVKNHAVFSSHRTKLLVALEGMPLRTCQ